MTSHTSGDGSTYPGDKNGTDITASGKVWWAIGVLFGARKFIAIMVVFVGIAALIITLLMPNVYSATSRVLVPEATGGLSGMMMRSLSSSAASLLGGRRHTDYVRYLAILHSRSLRESVIDSFDLVRVYKLDEKEHARDLAIEMLAENTSFVLSPDFEFLAISITDAEPQRAADMVNFAVHQINTMNADLSSQNAREYRHFIEQRYREAEAAVDSVLNAQQAFQEAHGILDLPSQAQGFYEYVGGLRAEAVAAEVEYEVLEQQYGETNPRVATARAVAQSADSKYRRALSGGEAIMPVPVDEVPSVARAYAQLELERRIQTTIIEVLRPMYEQAQLEERQRVSGIQILDVAVPPALKSGPRRALICIISVLSAFLLSCMFILTLTWWRQNHRRVAESFRRRVQVEQGTTEESVA